MDGVGFKARLRLLGRTQVGFAAEIGVAERTVHDWARQGPPTVVVYLLDLLTKHDLPLGPPDSGDESLKAAIDGQLHRLLASCREEFRPEILQLITDWVDQQSYGDHQKVIKLASPDTGTF
ncbi:hypothetical protein GCM10007890_54890 [Methylobacterium tardum]|uniref:Uncharacterized protein n=2 Tax=Methylobacterium tardum TaxID=374432 RepID=A0AA37TM98_9HYPH|nr:hypothetical protein GCM10007890_54890 [Methylobacterium tardum]